MRALLSGVNVAVIDTAKDAQVDHLRRIRDSRSKLTCRYIVQPLYLKSKRDTFTFTLLLLSLSLPLSPFTLTKLKA